VYLLNQICSKQFNPDIYECTKEYGKLADIAGILSGTWHIFIGIIGILGNLTTLFAIPYAAKRKRHEIDKNYYTTTVFLLHLSFIDLLHCVLMAIPRGVMFLGKSSPLGEHSCQIIMYAGMTIFVADMLAMTFVAISRCFDMVITNKWAKFCSKKTNIFLLFLLVWLVSSLTIPTLLKIQSYGIEIGWNCELGACGFIRNCNVLDATDVTQPKDSNSGNCNVRMEDWRIIYIIVLGIPSIALFVIICSYLLIWYKVHISKRHFLGTHETYLRLYGRERKMSCTILILIVLNVMFWFLAFGIIAFKYDNSLSSAWSPMVVQKYFPYIIVTNIFEIQYSLNFFVYMARKDQYRKAFLDMFKDFHRYTQRTFLSDRRSSVG
jgi:hypothetical protein